MQTQSHSSTRILAAALIMTILSTASAFAHRDDYLNETVVYLTLGRHELETEYWFDHGWQQGAGADFTRHNVATEFGITDKWMADGRATIVSGAGHGTRFDSGRFESRLRFADEGTNPVDLAVSLEFNAEREPDGSTSTGLEPRLIASRDIQEKLNFTLNVSEEIPLDSGSVSTLGALGARLNWTPLVRVGSELQYNFDEHTGELIPQVWFALRPETTLKVGYSEGLDQEHINFIRAALEVEF